MRLRRLEAVCPIGCCLALALLASPTEAQFLGHNFTGDMGLMSGTQGPPGWNVAAMYLRYDGETLRGPDGESIAIDPDEQGSLDANAYAVAITWVAEKKILGGNYSFGIFPAFTDNRFEVPILSLDEKVDTGFTDIYIQPINLGWHKQRADYIAGVGIYAPTGSYDVTADDNLGLGMWSFELFGGTTVYLDKAKSWHFATAAFYEIHTEKKGTDIKVGDILTLEGGLGKSWMEGALTAGIAYFAQWKVTDDRAGELQPILDELQLGRHRGYGFGPELTVPIATSKKLIGFINARFLWETGIRSQLEGTVFTLAASFPIPSIALQ